MGSATTLLSADPIRQTVSMPGGSVALRKVTARDRFQGTDSVVAVIENTAGQGNNIGFDLAHIAAIIDGVEDKTRVGVCVDTCHAFAAGYDLSSEDAVRRTIDEMDRVERQGGIIKGIAEGYIAIDAT